MSIAKYTLVEITKGLDYTRAGGATVNDRDEVLFGIISSNNAPFRSFVWVGGKVEEIHVETGRSQNCWGGDLNDRRQVVGSTGRDIESQAAYVWQQGRAQILPSEGGAVTYAARINSSGQIVGTTFGSHGEGCGLLWQDSKITGTGRAISNRPTHFISINNNGDVVGTEEVGSRSRIFKLSGKTVEYVQTDFDAGVADVNNHGHIVGSLNSNDYREEIAFLYKDKKIYSIGRLGGKRSSANSINDAMEIVGDSHFGSGPEYHAFLYSAGNLVDLNAVIGDPNVSLSSALSINKKGNILCVGNSRGKPHVYLLAKY